MSCFMMRDESRCSIRLLSSSGRSQYNHSGSVSVNIRLTKHPQIKFSNSLGSKYRVSITCFHVGSAGRGFLYEASCLSLRRKSHLSIPTNFSTHGFHLKSSERPPKIINVPRTRSRINLHGNVDFTAL